MNAELKREPDAEVLVTKAFLRVAESFKLKPATLSKVLMVSLSTVSRLQKDSIIKSNQPEWDRATTFIRIYRSLAGLLNGDVSAMLAWLTSHNTDLNAAPLALIERSGCGLYNVSAYLDSYRGRF